MSEPIKKEIREQILSRIKNDGVPVAQAAKEHGVNSKTVYGWLAKETMTEPTILEFNRIKRENQGLYQLIGQLTSELDKVKRGRLSK